ncbi:MAG: helix-turn-helix transcriptional regulator [Phycisphaerae bacterium]|nr:helix-turn-helix transcriptional regulator [Phycisphaerae bacterium]
MAERPTLRFLAGLFHHRWNVPVLAELRRTDGAKFVTLARRLDVSHDSLTRTLGDLVERGWVLRNAGYGHPLRPEYVLVPQARQLAERCLLLTSVLGRLGILDVAMKKWSMPILFALGSGHRRFSQLRAAMADATPRALSLTLKGLQPPGLVQRFVEGNYPPSSIYELTSKGRELTPVLATFEVN